MSAGCGLCFPLTLTLTSVCLQAVDFASRYSFFVQTFTFRKGLAGLFSWVRSALRAAVASAILLLLGILAAAAAFSYSFTLTLTLTLTSVHLQVVDTASRYSFFV